MYSLLLAVYYVLESEMQSLLLSYNLLSIHSAKSVLSLWLLPIHKFSTQARQQLYLLSVILLDYEAVEVKVDASHCLLQYLFLIQYHLRHATYH